MTKRCTCNREHWQPHAESCPAYEPKPLMTVENIRSGAIPADAVVVGFLLGEVERLQRESAWQSKEIDAQVQEIQRLRNREKDLMAVIDSRDKALGFVPLEDEPSSDAGGIDFDKDLARLTQIRLAHRAARPGDWNPAWQNSHVDCGFLLGFIDNLWREYSRSQNATPGATITGESPVPQASAEDSRPRELQPCECLVRDKEPSAYHNTKCPRFVPDKL